jgi:hypothetical protein
VISISERTSCEDTPISLLTLLLVWRPDYEVLVKRDAKRWSRADGQDPIFQVDRYGERRPGKLVLIYIETSCSLGVFGEGVLFATAAP